MLQRWLGGSGRCGLHLGGSLIIGILSGCGLFVFGGLSSELIHRVLVCLGSGCASCGLGISTTLVGQMLNQSLGSGS